MNNPILEVTHEEKESLMYDQKIKELVKKQRPYNLGLVACILTTIIVYYLPVKLISFSVSLFLFFKISIINKEINAMKRLREEERARPEVTSQLSSDEITLPESTL